LAAIKGERTRAELAQQFGVRRPRQTGSVAECKAMIDRDHDLSVRRLAPGSSRGRVHHLPRPVADADLAPMRRIDEPPPEYPFAGALGAELMP